MDKVYKFKDVPKGQRLRYFFDYNFLPLMGIIFAIVLIVVMSRFFFFSPKPDYGVILVNTDSEEYMLSGFHSELSQCFDETIGDVNGDGENIYTISYSNINEDLAMKDPEYYGANVDKYYAQLSSGKSLILVGDESAFERSFIGEKICALNDELGLSEYSVHEKYVKIPFTQIESLKKLKNADKLFLSICSKEDIDFTNESIKSNYDNNLKAFRIILGIK